MKSTLSTVLFYIFVQKSSELTLWRFDFLLDFMIVQVAWSNATITSAAMHPNTVYKRTSESWKKAASFPFADSSGAATTKKISLISSDTFGICFVNAEIEKSWTKHELNGNLSFSVNFNGWIKFEKTVCECFLYEIQRKTHLIWIE